MTSRSHLWTTTGFALLEIVILDATPSFAQKKINNAADGDDNDKVAL